jgi:DNA-entry nuclease
MNQDFVMWRLNMRKKKNVTQWVFAIMFLCCALGTGFRVGSLFYLMAAVLMAPIKELREKIKLPKALIITLSVVLCFLGAMISPVDTSTEDGLKDKQEISQDIEDEGEESEEADDVKDEEKPSVGSEHSTVKDTSSIEVYSGVAYTVINDNIPSFSSEELTTIGYEKYSDLDSLGRCGVAIASCGKEIMPKEGEERGSISSVTPTGWVQAKYEGVSGGYLYNRCHLIGWQLSAENANKKNLLTGTRYMNTEGMLVFENMVADYIKETGNHVAYRITPIYEGNNLVASGVQMEAYSIEDEGEGICFNVYCYNVQPGIEIDYATGESALAKQAADPNEAKLTYVVNNASRKFHLESCTQADSIKPENRESFETTRSQMLAWAFEPAGCCDP